MTWRIWRRGASPESLEAVEKARLELAKAHLRSTAAAAQAERARAVKQGLQGHLAGNGFAEIVASAMVAERSDKDQER